jgi:hypothetical protein
MGHYIEISQSSIQLFQYVLLGWTSKKVLFANFAWALAKIDPFLLTGTDPLTAQWMTC